VYVRIAAIALLRSRNSEVGNALRHGRQYLREVSGEEVRDSDVVIGAPRELDTGKYMNWGLPGKGEIAAWSRIHCDREVLIVTNTNNRHSKGAWVTVDCTIHKGKSSQMEYIYHSEWSDEVLKHGSTSPPATAMVRIINWHAMIWVALPPAGMAILTKF